MPAFQVIVCPWPLIPVVVPRQAVQISFPLFVVMNSMVDCNEMSIAQPWTCKNLSNNQNLNLQHPEW